MQLYILWRELVHFVAKTCIFYWRNSVHFIIPLTQALISINYKQYKRRLAAPHHRSFTFPASARTAVLPATLLTLWLWLSRSIIIPIQHHRRSVCKTDFDCKCLSLDCICNTRNCVIRVIANVQSLQIRIGRSIYSVLAHPIIGSSIPESICLLSILQRRYLPCFLCSVVVQTLSAR